MSQLKFKLKTFLRFSSFPFRLIFRVAKTPRILLECSKTGRWFLLLYSYVTYYMIISLTSFHPLVYFFILWFFLQYQLAIFLVSAIQPKSLTTNQKCPICLANFSHRFHHCFLVNRCIANCNVHCFLSFTFYATIATLLSFVLLIQQYFYVQTIGYSCLLPFGEIFCRNITWKQSGIVMITRSTIMSAGCASAMGLYVAKEYYYDQTDKSRRIWKEIIQILLPAFSVIRTN